MPGAPPPCSPILPQPPRTTPIIPKPGGTSTHRPPCSPAPGSLTMSISELAGPD